MGLTFMQNKCFIFVLIVISIFMTSCRSVGDDATAISTNEEMAQQIGDVMSSVDEAAGTGGSFAWMNQIEASRKSLFAFQKKSMPSKTNFLQLVVPSAAVAATCFGNGFSTCTANSITRTFNSCTLGSATFTGSVALAFTGPTQATCKLAVSGDVMKRTPSFSVSYNSASIAVSKSGTNGESLTYVSNTGANKVLSLANDGLRRVVTVDSVVMYDTTTSTFNSSGVSAPITITGSDRTNRILSGGTIRLQNNLSGGERCHISPSAVTWSGGTCTCATSGTWTGTCENKGAFTLSITGCGTANLTVGTETTSVSLNRCLGS